jgi:hypothetical protein
MNTPKPPSPQTISNTTEVLELASLLDPRIPTPDKARILAWARQIERHNLERDDMLDATQNFYDHPHPQPISVGDVITGARRLKRDRLDREEDQQREARQTAQEAKGAELIDLTAEALTTRTNHNRTPRLAAAKAALDNCHGRNCAEAIREYNEALKAAKKSPNMRTA